MDSLNGFEGSDIHERHMDLGSSLVLGNQWGDEGKGKVVDIFTQVSDVVIRFQGGHNAGHTVKVGDKEFDLHILPSGVVSEGKINLISSGCVLGIELNKIDLEKIKISKSGVSCDCKLDELLKRKDGEKIRVGLIPELEKLKKGGIDVSKSGLKISGETIVIGMHNVLLDGYDEKCRSFAGLEPIGSTGSGISRAYASKNQRLHFTLNDLLKREDDFYASIEALWVQYRGNFPLINVEELIAHAKKEREYIIEMMKKGELEIIDNEKEYIDNLANKGKKIIGEGAQSSMIGSGNSYFGTASKPSFETFSSITGLTKEQVGNIFIVHKMPASSVGYRPQFLKHNSSPAVESFIDNYGEVGVSTGRRRDLFHFSLPETAKGVVLNTNGIGDESKIVPVFNRVDGLADTAKFYPDGIMQIVTGYQYQILNVLTGKIEYVPVGITNGEHITPKNALSNYPQKSDQLSLFNINTEIDLSLIQVTKNRKKIHYQTNNLIRLLLSSIYSSDGDREILIGTGPKRDDLELILNNPIRHLES